MIKVFHICPDFFYTKLYGLLISHLSDTQQNLVYVPSSEIENNTSCDVAFLGRDFGLLDRLLFFRKQFVLKKDIVNRGLYSDCNIVHAHCLFSAGYTARKLSLEYGIPYVVAVRNTDVNVFFRYMLHLRSVGVEILHDAAAVIFISPSYKKQVLENYIPAKYRNLIENKSYVIPNGIDSLFLDNCPDEKSMPLNGKINLIYVGEINTNKNLQTTLKACVLLESQGVYPTIKVVGPITDPQYEWIKDNRFVEYHPLCPKEEVLKFLRSSDIFVMPSLKETFGLVYIEALSQGVPIVYSEGQGLDGYFEEGYVGYHVNSKNSEQICNAVLQITSDYKSISERCVKAAKQFSWDRISGVYKDIYKKIM